MKLAYLTLKIVGSWPEMVRQINAALEERGTDASSIISVDVERNRELFTTDWITVFYREA